MKKILLCLFSFLFIGTALTGSVFLLAGCNQSYSQEDNEENNNENENNTGEDIPDEDEEISAQGYRLDAYIMSFNQAYPSGYNNTNGGTVETCQTQAFFGHGYKMELGLEHIIHILLIENGEKLLHK